MTTRDYESILFTPDRSSQATAAYLGDRRTNKHLAIKVGLAGFDKDFLPLYPGELCSIVARPGNGKTGFMVRWARNRSAWLRENKITDRVVVYVTIEQSVEELNAFNIAANERISITDMARGEISDAEWTRCLKASVDRQLMPLWNIGYSSTVEGEQIAIDLDAVEGALRLIHEKHKKKIDIMFIDYLQRFPEPGSSESKTVGVSANLRGIKTIALRHKLPVVLGVQAKREVDDYADKTPELNDGQWTSNIEQDSDRQISLMRPAKYWEIGETTQIKTLRNMPITKNMMVIYVAKQKLGKDNWPYLAFFDPEYNKLDELELRHYDL